MKKIIVPILIGVLFFSLVLQTCSQSGDGQEVRLWPKIETFQFDYLKVSGMVLRGIFTATQEEIDHFYHGGVRAFFPEIYEALIQEIPEKDRNAIPKALLQKVQGPDKTVKDKVSLLWTKYEYTLAMLRAMIEFE